MVPQILSPEGLIQTPGGLLYGALGQKIVVVHNSGPGNLDEAPAWYNENGRTSVNLALDLLRSGRGDVVQLLPGHTDTISAADGWSNLGTKTGITVRGPDYGPPATIKWTVATSSLLMDTADFVIDGGPNRNIILEMDSTAATTVAAPITVTGARCKIRNCRIRVASGAAQLVTDAIHVNAVADFLLENCFIHGAAAGVLTTVCKTTGAADRIRIMNNYIAASIATAASGILLDFSNAAILDLQISGNFLENTTAASAFVGSLHAASTGEVSYNRVKVDDTAAAITARGFTPIGANNTLVGYFQNRLVDDDGLADGLLGTASA